MTQDRIRLAQNSINILLYIGILLSSAIILNSARQRLPNLEKPKEKPKRKVVRRKDQQIKAKNSDVAISQERLKVSKQRRDQGIKRESVKRKNK